MVFWVNICVHNRIAVRRKWKSLAQIKKGLPNSWISFSCRSLLASLFREGDESVCMYIEKYNTCAISIDWEKKHEKVGEKKRVLPGKNGIFWDARLKRKCAASYDCTEMRKKVEKVGEERGEIKMHFELGNVTHKSYLHTWMILLLLFFCALAHVQKSCKQFWQILQRRRPMSQLFLKVIMQGTGGGRLHIWLTYKKRQ